jgi:hypothetical protein
LALVQPLLFAAQARKILKPAKKEFKNKSRTGYGAQRRKSMTESFIQ